MSRNNRLNDTDARRMTRVSSPCSDTTPPQLRVHRKTTARPSQPECIIGTIVGTNASPESIASYTSTNATTSSARSPNTVSTTTVASSSSTSRVKKSTQAAKAAQSRKEKELVQTTVTQLCREFAKKKKQQEGKKKKAESSDDDDDDLSKVIYVSSSGKNTKRNKNNDDQYIECIGSTPPPSYPRSFYTPTMSDTTQSKQSRNVKRMRDIMTSSLCQHCQNVICHDEQYGGFMEAKIDNVAKQSGKKTFTHIEVYEHCIGIYNVLAEYKVYDAKLIVKDNVVTLPTCLYTGTYKRLLAKWLSNGQDERGDMLSHVAWSHLEQEMQNRKRRARKNSRYTY
jgi:hypothetical protein